MIESEGQAAGSDDAQNSNRKASTPSIKNGSGGNSGETNVVEANYKDFTLMQLYAVRDKL